MKTLKTKLLVFVTILMLGMTAAAPAFSDGPAFSDDYRHHHRCLSSGKECRNEAISVVTDGINDNTDGINDNAARIEQVNKEDMRVKSGTVNGNTLRLRVEDMAATPGRSEIYGKNVDIDLSDLDQSQEVGDNSSAISTNTTNINNNTTNINNNTTNIGNNADDIDRNSDRISNNDVDIFDNRVVSGAALGNSIRNSVNIENNEDRLDQNDVTNNRQDRDIDLNAYGIETNRRAIVDTNARIDGVMNDMRYLDRNLSAGIASAVAMGQHNFDPTYQGGQVSIAGGHFNGANAVSLAVGVPAGSNAFFSLSAAANDGPGNESIGMGLTYRLPK